MVRWPRRCSRCRTARDRAGARRRRHRDALAVWRAVAAQPARRRGRRSRRCRAGETRIEPRPAAKTAAAGDRADGADRLGQDRAGARLGAAPGHANRQRRLGAGVSPPRHRQRQAGRGDAGAHPHHLVDVRDPHEVYSAADSPRDALAAMQSLAARGRVPILAGGTGLYFQALLDGLSEMPAPTPALRARCSAKRRRAAGRPCTRSCARVDPAAAARIHANDPQRIVRALEVYRLTGVPISAWQAAREPHALSLPRAAAGAVPARRGCCTSASPRASRPCSPPASWTRCARCAPDPRLHPDLPAMRAVGYRQAWRHLDGDTDAGRHSASRRSPRPGSSPSAS